MQHQKKHKNPCWKKTASNLIYCIFVFYKGVIVYNFEIGYGRLKFATIINTPV